MVDIPSQPEQVGFVEITQRVTEIFSTGEWIYFCSFISFHQWIDQKVIEKNFRDEMEKAQSLPSSFEELAAFFETFSNKIIGEIILNHMPHPDGDSEDVEKNDEKIEEDDDFNIADIQESFAQLQQNLIIGFRDGVVSMVEQPWEGSDTMEVLQSPSNQRDNVDPFFQKLAEIGSHVRKAIKRVLNEIFVQTNKTVASPLIADIQKSLEHLAFLYSLREPDVFSIAQDVIQTITTLEKPIEGNDVTQLVEKKVAKQIKLRK